MKNTFEGEIMGVTEGDLSNLRPDALAPAAIEAKAETLSVGKANMPFGKLFVLAMFAGAFIACGAMLFTLVQADADFSFGVKRVLGGGCFALGLILVVNCGAELFTGNCLMVCGLGSRKIDVRGLAYNWVVVWLGNLVGSLIIVALVFGSKMADMNGGAVGAAMVSIAAGKISPDALTLICKGILCNFLVCLAVWISFAGRTVTDKVLGVFLPVLAFVACGFEHCVANMFFLPMGWAAQAAGYAAGTIDLAGIAYNISLATVGNIIGGAIMVGLGYWIAYRKKDDAPSKK